jgi:hypothetical protein
MPGFSSFDEEDRYDEITITVRAHKAGPRDENVLQFGQLIRFSKEISRQLVYEKFPSDSNFFDNKTFDCQVSNTIGIIVGSGWCLNKSTKNLTLSNGLVNASNQLWYNVEFSEGTGWVRYDWIEIVK